MSYKFIASQVQCLKRLILLCLWTPAKKAGEDDKKDCVGLKSVECYMYCYCSLNVFEFYCEFLIDYFPLVMASMRSMVATYKNKQQSLSLNFEISLPISRVKVASDWTVFLNECFTRLYSALDIPIPSWILRAVSRGRNVTGILFALGIAGLSWITPLANDFHAKGPHDLFYS